MTDLLELALNAHGGLDKWQRATQLHADLSLTGGLYGFKGQPRGFGPTTMSVDLRSPRVMSHPFPDAGQRGIFTLEKAWIEEDGGRIIEERCEPRKALEGVAKAVPWSALETLSFTSYAMWNYLTTPLLLTMPGVETKEVWPLEQNGEIWRTLRVLFPPGMPTHSQEQFFYFSEAGLLQRLDYHAVGPAAHYCFDHKEFDGLVFPTLRRVVGRNDLAAKVSGPTAVLIQIENIRVE